jgi:N-methylhydantoinase B
MPDYLRPETLHEALGIRATRDVAVMAGGTDIYPAWVTRKAWGDPTHKDVLDVSRLPGLRGVMREGAGWRLGALTTWTDLIRADLPPLFDGFKAAAREVGGVQIQNRGTLAGNICTASPAGDGIPCLMALDAEVELTSLRGVRRLPITAFNIGYRQTALAPDEIVTALHVRDRSARSAFVKLGARRYLVISIAMASCVIGVDDGGRIDHARVAVGACAPAALRLTALERRLIGVMASSAPAMATVEDVASLAPIDDVRATGAFRADGALMLVRDVLAMATSLKEAA